MTCNKLLSRLLKMKDFRVTWFDFLSDTHLFIGVKPYKSGCRCPQCGKRGKIVTQFTTVRQWEDVVVCGRRCIFFMRPKRSTAANMAGFRSAYLGLPLIPG